MQSGRSPLRRGLAPDGKALAIDAAKDIDLTLPDIPDRSLAADWTYLCRQMRADLMMGPEQTLAALDAVRQRC